MTEPHTYVITFERIGQHENVPPIRIEAGPHAGQEEISLLTCNAVLQHSRAYILSNYATVTADLETGTVGLYGPRGHLIGYGSVTRETAR